MNNSRDLLKRLLHLFPIKIVKEHFNEAGKMDDVIDAITGNKPPVTIKHFARDNYLQTKQNIYLFTLNKVFNHTTITSSFPLTIESEVVNGSEVLLFCLPKTTYSVYLSTPTDKQDLIFFQPVIIKLQGKTMSIHFTKLQKNEKNYFPEKRTPKRASIDYDETNILEDILKHIGKSYTVVPNDINKGIKYIWHVDDVDCVKVQWREAHSVNSATMNQSLTYKKKYPAEYKELIKTPLEKNNFIYLKTDDYFCEAFVADPTEGRLSITRSPKTPNQVTNVLTKILANN